MTRGEKNREFAVTHPYATAFIKHQKWLSALIKAHKVMRARNTHHTRMRAHKMHVGTIAHFDSILRKLQTAKIKPF